MDKFFLLTYTCTEYDGFRHSFHSWFATEEEMKAFVEQTEKKGSGIEVDLAIEILSYRRIEW